MSGHHNPQEEDLQEYPLRSGELNFSAGAREVPLKLSHLGSGAPIMHWNSEGIYAQSAHHTQQISPYAMPHSQPANQPHWTMEPAQRLSDYQLSSDHLGFLIPQSNSNLPASDHRPHQNDHAHPVYSPASSGGLYASPSFQSVPASSLSHSPLLRSSPSGTSQGSTSLPARSDTLPRDVRDAMNAAYASVEWAAGANVPADILLPTVQKLGKELWRCRICGKDHKRRDHTLTHVRTSHLDNKGFRCTFEGCDSAFGRKGDLERHVTSTHQGSYEAVCPYCNSQLHRKDNLTRHIKSCRMVPSNSSSSHPSSRRGESSLAYSAPYPTVRHDPSQGHGHILALNRSVSSSA